MSNSITGPYRRIKVTVRNADRPACPWITRGVVLIDGHRVGFLVGAKPRIFHVAPGEHTIGVILDSTRLETGPVLLEEGDRLDLVCGRRRPPAEALKGQDEGGAVVRSWRFWRRGEAYLTPLVDEKKTPIGEL